MADFIEDFLGIIMPRERQAPRRFEPHTQPAQAPYYPAQQNISPQYEPQPPQYQLQHQQDVTMSSAPMRRQRTVQSYNPTAPQYEDVEAMASKMLNQFNMRDVKREYEEHMYELNDRITNRSHRGYTPPIRGNHIPEEQQIELKRLEEEDRKIEGTMESRLWYLADAYSVHTKEGRVKLFDIIESLFTFMKVNNVYGIIEYVKVVIPKTLELITVHVKLFEDYEQRDQNKNGRITILNGLVEDYFGHIQRLENEKEELKRELYWEYRYKGLRAYYEKKFGHLGMSGKQLASYLNELEAETAPDEEAEEEEQTERGGVDPRVARMNEARARKASENQEDQSAGRKPRKNREFVGIPKSLRPMLGKHKSMTPEELDEEVELPSGEEGSSET